MITRQPPLVESAAWVLPVVGWAAPRQEAIARTAKLAASTPMTQPGPVSAVSPPAREGPRMKAAWLKVDSSALPVTRSCSGSTSAMSVYMPALPHACSSDDTASSST